MAAHSAPADSISILPLSSGLNPEAEVRRAVDALSLALDAHGVRHTLAAPGGHPPDVIFVVTGGTEHHALAALERIGGPALLIAHAEQNSLPAALEILGRSRQLGRRGRIYLLGERRDGLDALDRLARHLAVRRRLRAARLGRIGAPSDWLVASTPAAVEVGEAWGPALVDVPIDEVRAAMADADPEASRAIAGDYLASASSVGEPSAEDVERAARAAVALREVVARHRLDACAVRCFDLVTAERTTGCLALSWLLDHGVVAGCEGDVPATITMLWVEAMSGGPAFLANPQDVDAATNTVALAHCTIARTLVSSYALRSHFESALGVGIAGVIDPGEATLARVGGADLRSIWMADGHVVGGGTNERRCRTQALVRLSSDAGVLLTQPLGNHVVLARGRWEAPLREYHDLFVAR